MLNHTTAALPFIAGEFSGKTACAHTLFIYDSEQDLLGVVRSLLRDGTSRMDRHAVALGPGVDRVVGESLRAIGVDTEVVEVSTVTACQGEEADVGDVVQHLYEVVQREDAPLWLVVSPTALLGGSPAPEQLADLEARIERDLSSDCRVLCCYDRSEEDPEVLRMAMRVHPAVVKKSQIVTNTSYISAFEGTCYSVEEEGRAACLHAVDAEGDAEIPGELCRQIFEHSSQAISVVRPDGRILYFNRAFCDLTGYSSRELREINWDSDLTPPEWRRMNAEIMDRLRETGQPQRFEKEYLTRDGGRKPVELRAHQVSDADGRLLYYYSFISDISSRREAEDDLALTQEKMEKLHQVAFLLEQAETEDQVYRTTVEAAEDTLDLMLCVVDMVDGDMLIPRASSSHMTSDGITVMSKDEGIAGKTYRTGKTHIIDDLRADPEARPARPDYRSIISIPIGDMGVFQAVSSEVAAFNDGDAALLETLLSHAAGALRRMRTSEALRRGREEFRTLAAEYELIFEGTKDGVFLLDVTRDRQFPVRRINPALKEMLGINGRDVRGLPIEDLLGSISPAVLQDQLARCISCREAAVLDLEFGTDPETRHFQFRLAPIAANGRVTHIVGSVREVTEQKEMEAALQESEQKYRILAERANDMIVIIQDDVFAYANAAAEEVLGYRVEDLVGSPWIDRVQPGERARITGYHEHRLAGEEAPPIYDTILIHKDGHRVHVEVSASVIAYRGRPANLTILRDVTERRNAEENLRHMSMHDQMTSLYNRTYFEDALNRLNVPRQMPLSVIMGDVNGLKLVNDAFGHKMGDRLLQRIARVIEQCCRSEDIVARIGGDEFAVILPRTSGEVARGLIRRINERCRAAMMGPVNLSISFGSATRDGDALDQDIHQVLKAAEDRMYRNKMLEMDSVRSALISSLVNALTEKSQENEGHAERLEDLAVAVGTEMDLDDNYLADLTLLARLHDVGKVVLPDEILMKDGPLTDEDWVQIKRHPEAGFRIAQTSPEMAPVARAILTHHEFYDGSGYPQGLKGEEIPMIARVIAVADAYDAMTSGRPYRQPVRHQEALEEIKRCAGSQFDPDVARVFVRIFEEGPPWQSDDP